MSSTSNSALPSRASPAYRYRAPAIALHWAIFLLIAVAYAVVELKGYFPKGSTGRANMMTIHEWAGIFVLVLAVPRLFWRWARGVPPDEPGQVGWMMLLSGLTHFVLYLFIFAQPVLGLLTLNAGGHALELSSLGISMPPLVGADDALKATVKDIHELIGNVFYAVIGLHAVAALWHHYVLKDNTLRKML